ncbi:MAG: hypothetical protein P8X55_14780 [Desulfosarcinaceae bacterium]
MEIVENIALITINETLIFQLVSFLVFLFILNRIMIRPLPMEQDILSADQTYKEISHQIHHEDAIARREAFKERDKLEVEGQHAASDLIEKTKEEISAMRLKAQQETDAKIAAARQELHMEVDILSDQMIAALLGRRSTS